MQGFVSSLITASLLLSPSAVIAKAGHLNTNSPQSAPVEQPAPCERVRITLNDGHKIETDSYQHQGDHIKFIHKGALQIIPDKDIKRIEVRQGSCPDIVVMLKTGEKIEGYRRNHFCANSYNCKTEIKQTGRRLTIADSDIKTSRLKFKTTFRQKLKNVALIPIYPFSYLILLIVCSKGCDDL
jgi:hypothetical protein